MRAGGGKKNFEAQVEIEKDTEVVHFLQRLSQDKGVDLEAWEEGLRTAVLSAGAGVLERLLHEEWVAGDAFSRWCVRAARR